MFYFLFPIQSMPGGKDYIIHFAKTPPLQSGDAKEGAVFRIKSISDINEEWVADHARQATKMLPGAMHVLGLFIISPEDVLNPFSTKLKSILTYVYKQLNLNKYLFGNPEASEKLLINYRTSSQQYGCKSYDVGSGSVMPAEIKFLPNATKWVQVECSYQMDQVHHIKENESDWPLKKHMGVNFTQLILLLFIIYFM